MVDTATKTAGNAQRAGLFGTVASVLGLFFSGFSVHDYTAHLDRQLHGAHCSFIPGLTGVEAGANACTAAMYSPWSALFRGSYWGGIPIALFAFGSYAFFLAFSLYLLLAKGESSRPARLGFAAATAFPLVATVAMFTISLTQLGAFCKLCVGMYVSSVLLGIGGFFAFSAWREAGTTTAGKRAPGGTLIESRPQQFGGPDDNVATARDGAPATGTGGNPFPIVLASLVVLGIAAVLPAGVYAASLPDYRPYLGGCGKLVEKEEKHKALLVMPTTAGKRAATFFEDPLCPTCKGFHERLVSDGIYDRLTVQSSMFPLDSDCNWMIDRSLHPGACVLAKAIICGDKSSKARQVLEWAYDEQEDLTNLGKTNKDALRAKIKGRFPDIDSCIDSKETKQRLDQMLQFAVTNKIAVSTPQFFLGDSRVCDEDTDLGLKYTLTQIAPEVVP